MDGLHSACVSEDCVRGVLEERFSVSCKAPVSHIQVDCCSSVCAFPLQGNELCIQSIADPSLQPLQLKGHHHSISAVTFGNRQKPLLICSASEDYVIVWDVERCRKKTEEGLIAMGTIVGTLLGNVSHLSICPRDEKVAACTGAKIYILNIKQEEVLSVFEGHLAAVTAAVFPSWNADIIVSISEDRTFKVWNLSNEELIHQSAVLSGSPLLSVFLSEMNKQLITGSADGQVWVFSLLSEHKYRLVTRVDLQKTEQRYLKNKAFRETQKGTSIKDSLEKDNKVETVNPVLRIAPFISVLDTRGNANRFCSRSGSYFWIGSSDGVYLINLATSELCTVMHFKDYPGLTIAMAGSWAIQQGNQTNVFCLLTSMFEDNIALVQINVTVLAESHCYFNGQECPGEDNLYVVARRPLLPDSLLSSDVLRKDASKPPKKSAVKNCVKDQPVVFHSKVKSSGYTAPGCRTMFSPKTNTQKKNHQLSKSSKKNEVLFKDYPADCPAPSILQTHLNATAKPTPVCSLQFSGDGKQVVCGLSDTSILLYNSTLSGAPAVYTGHDGAVRCVGWSHCNQWLLSASEDRTLRIWPVGITQPALTLGGERFPQPLRSAQFYYMDKFLLLSCGPLLQLYLYHLDTSQDDIKRYKQKSLCKLVEKFQMTTGTEITSVSAVNDFFSYIVLVAGNDHAVEAFDLNVGRRAACIPDAHTRAVHHIAQNKGSMFSTQEPDAYNLFLTSSVTDGIKLWDLRTLRCVQRYEGHVNRCHPCTAAFSPCGQYIATGSENNCLLTATLDGKLQLFRP
nr:PREDICTED: WD repeat-containing protein 27 isoform X2 [Lepisosteus oculatus]